MYMYMYIYSCEFVYVLEGMYMCDLWVCVSMHVKYMCLSICIRVSVSMSMCIFLYWLSCQKTPLRRNWYTKCHWYNSKIPFGSNLKFTNANVWLQHREELGSSFFNSLTVSEAISMNRVLHVYLPSSVYRKVSAAWLLTPQACSSKLCQPGSLTVPVLFPVVACSSICTTRVGPRSVISGSQSFFLFEVIMRCTKECQEERWQRSKPQGKKIKESLVLFTKTQIRHPTPRPPKALLLSPLEKFGHIFEEKNKLGKLLSSEMISLWQGGGWILSTDM